MLAPIACALFVFFAWAVAKSGTGLSWRGLFRALFA